jgi:hypothetical protein
VLAAQLSLLCLLHSFQSHRDKPVHDAPITGFVTCSVCCGLA